MEKLVLVPQSEFGEFKNWKASSSSSTDILQAIRKPEEREMIKKFNLAQSIINDSNEPYVSRKRKYDEKMQDFRTIKNKISSTRSTPSFASTRSTPTR